MSDSGENHANVAYENGVSYQATNMTRQSVDTDPTVRPTSGGVASATERPNSANDADENDEHSEPEPSTAQSASLSGPNQQPVRRNTIRQRRQYGIQGEPTEPTSTTSTAWKLFETRAVSISTILALIATVVLGVGAWIGMNYANSYAPYGQKSYQLSLFQTCHDYDDVKDTDFCKDVLNAGLSVLNVRATPSSTNSYLYASLAEMQSSIYQYFQTAYFVLWVFPMSLGNKSAFPGFRNLTGLALGAFRISLFIFWQITLFGISRYALVEMIYRSDTFFWGCRQGWRRGGKFEVLDRPFTSAVLWQWFPLVFIDIVYEILPGTTANHLSRSSHTVGSIIVVLNYAALITILAVSALFINQQETIPLNGKLVTYLFLAFLFTSLWTPIPCFLVHMVRWMSAVPVTILVLLNFLFRAQSAPQAAIAVALQAAIIWEYFVPNLVFKAFNEDYC